MTFPVTVGDRVFPHAPALLAGVLVDARAGGGTIFFEQPPSRWLLPLVDAGRLARETAVALAAALLRGADPAGVCEGARLAAPLNDARLLPLIRFAVEGHDIGLLLATDPLCPGQSVEDALLRAWAELAGWDDPAHRGTLLERLRNAGLAEAELGVLARCGTEEEVRMWLPIVLIEGLPPGGSEALAVGCARPEPIASLFRLAAEAFPGSARGRGVE